MERQRSVRGSSQEGLLKVVPQDPDGVVGTLGAHGGDVQGQELFAVAHVAGVHLDMKIKLRIR